MKLKMAVTFKQMKESKSKTIYYSSRTAWWTDDPKDLQGSGDTIPLDIFGAPLFQAPKNEFLEHVEAKPEHYGKYGIEGFMACHHKNFTPDEGETHGMYGGLDIFKRTIHQYKMHDPSFSLL